MELKDIGEKAVLDLQEAIDNKDIDAILAAYELVESDSFDWEKVPDYIFECWDKLVDEANDIMYN